MPLSSLIRLLSLAAIWGSSFLFMRIAVGSLGPVALIAGRVFFAALFLAGVGYLVKQALDWRANWAHYFILGLFNSALPFLMFAFASQTLTASVLAVLNATAPIWGALIGIIWYQQRVSWTVLVGLVTGISGVAILVGFDPVLLQPGAFLAIGAAAGAAFSYGIATHYTRTAKKVAAFANAHGSMWSSTLMVAPLMAIFPPQATVSTGVALAVLALGIVCSGIAYLLFFRLVEDEGATSALTVTFLIPVFGVLWGHLFLQEPIGWHTVSGVLIVITGTALVTGFKPSFLRKID